MTRRRSNDGGQTLAEFAISITVFLLILLGIVDAGRAVYQLSAVSQAAREIARTTSVHPGTTLGNSTETADTVAVQRRLVPGLSVSSYACVDIGGVAVTGPCKPGNWVRVTVVSRFDPSMPALTLLGPINLASSGSAEIE
ncbi:MAG: pilus assembly protein [Chloroflexota bacterium]|nr:pilus assembly protein [Chloroflexota bacterium]